MGAPVGGTTFYDPGDGTNAFFQRALLVDITGAALITTNGLVVQGNVAHDGVDAGNPIKVGGKAILTAIPTAVASLDRADAIFDSGGRQIVHPYAPRDLGISGVTAAIVDTTSTQLLPSAGAGTRNYITTWTVANGHATVGTYVNLLDAGGAALWTVYARAGETVTVEFPMPLRMGSAVATNVVCVTTGSNIIASAMGFKWT
jgi:hypothetical protein